MTSVRYSKTGKRLLDLILAALALVILAPVMLVVGVGVALFLGRPIIFRQVRPGLNSRPFKLLKFRTMRVAGPVAQPDGDRLTRFGRVVRSLSVDELPELWNVLRGDMSLVGPRPLLLEYLPLYTTEQARRHEVRPGITGLAQVSGRNDLTWEQKFARDVEYVDNVSFLLDCRILMMTIAQVLSRHGINQTGHATAEKFTGSAQNT